MTTLNSTVTADTYDEVLRLARKALATAEARVAALKPAADRAAAPISDDPAIVSGIRRRSTPTQQRREDARTDRDLQTYTEYLAAEKDLAGKRARVERLEASAPVPFTEEQLRSATAVRTDVGWYRLLKVNRATVGVEAEAVRVYKDGDLRPHKVTVTGDDRQWMATVHCAGSRGPTAESMGVTYDARPHRRCWVCATCDESTCSCASEVTA